MTSKKIRLQKFIAQCGVASRRKAEAFIVAGNVSINGQVVTKLGTSVSPHDDIISVNDQVISTDAQDHFYFIFHKPRGVISSTFDPEGRRTVTDYFKHISTRLFPVGRLDYYSEGLLIITNDGEMTQRILHPKNEVIKTYKVKIFGHVNNQIVQKMEKGIWTPQNEFLKPLSVEVISNLPNKTWLKITLVEGKNREIRKLCEACGTTVDKLKRVAIGGLTLQGLASGNYKSISKQRLLKEIFSQHLSPNQMALQQIEAKRKQRPKKLTLRKGQFSAIDPKFIKFRKRHYVQTMASRKNLSTSAS